MHQIIDAKLLELQHHCTKVRPQDFRIGVVLHFTLISFLSIQPETFARTSTASTTCSLLGTGFRDGRHQQRFNPDTRIIHLFVQKYTITT